MNPFILSSLLGAGASLLGQRRDQAFSLAATREANAASAKQLKMANQFNVKQARKAQQTNKANTYLADKLNDKNTAMAQKYNSAQAQAAMRFSGKQADKANAFTAEQNRIANELSEAQALRNRDWAQQDYAQQRTDLSNQFVDMRAAAEKGGFNPLAVMGAQMVPSLGAGGLSSSSFAASPGAAAPGVAGSSVASPVAGVAPASVPMSYGAPVAVAPLVSNDAVVGAVSELGRELTGVNAVQRQNDQLMNDLAQIELDQARAGAPMMPVGPTATESTDYVDSFPAHQATPGVASLRPPAVPVGNVSSDGSLGGSDIANYWSSGFSDPQFRIGMPGDSTRPIERAPTQNISGLMEIENDIVGRRTIVGADGEPADLSQLAAVGLQIGAQEGHRAIRDRGLVDNANEAIRRAEWQNFYYGDARETHVSQSPYLGGQSPYSGSGLSFPSGLGMPNSRTFTNLPSF